MLLKGVGLSPSAAVETSASLLGGCEDGREGEWVGEKRREGEGMNGCDREREEGLSIMCYERERGRGREGVILSSDKCARVKMTIF